jgi:hypothetical protein
MTVAIAWKDPETEWLDVPGLEGRYMVSNDGQVLSLLGRHPCPMKTWLEGDRKKYLAVKLRSNGRTIGVYVHQLVARAFLGPPPAGAWRVEFKDRDPTNCRADNLQWAPLPEVVKPWLAKPGRKEAP